MDHPGFKLFNVFVGSSLLPCKCACGSGFSAKGIVYITHHREMTVFESPVKTACLS